MTRHGPVQPAPEGRLHALDALRAVAMFLGIVLHAACSFSFPLGTWPVRDVAAGRGFDLMLLAIHGFRMHLFFLLAGFFARLLVERLGPRAFARQRLVRIGVPFLLGLVVFVMPFLIIALWNVVVRQPELLEHALRRPTDAIGPPTGHLWFLEYLLIYYAVAVAVIWLSGKARLEIPPALDRTFDSLMRSPVRMVVFVPLTVACLWNGPFWGDAEYPGAGFVPTARALAHYGLFFLAGWWLHRRRGMLEALTRFIGPTLGVAVVALAVHATILSQNPQSNDPNYFALKITSLSCAGIYAWAMSLGATGAFLRYAGQASERVRYLSDSAYWCYLAHPPLVLWLQAMIASWRFPAPAKLLLLIAITMVVLLVVYEHSVRYTRIGTLLNGPRPRPIKLQPVAVTGEA